MTREERDLQLQIIFVFLIVFAVMLFVVRPEPTRFQMIFRGAIAATGVVGLVYVQRRKRTRT